MAGLAKSQCKSQEMPASHNCVSFKTTEDPKVKAKGVYALGHLFRIYFNMLIVVAFLALWLTTVYGALSYAGPNIFCKDHIELGLSKVPLANCGLSAQTKSSRQTMSL
jgi:hypothetical protein